MKTSIDNLISRLLPIEDDEVYFCFQYPEFAGIDYTIVNLDDYNTFCKKTSKIMKDVTAGKCCFVGIYRSADEIRSAFYE